jgi:hypothetical protein
MAVAGVDLSTFTSTLAIKPLAAGVVDRTSSLDIDALTPEITSSLDIEDFALTTGVEETSSLESNATALPTEMLG